jgi:hypothetical protein
MDSIAICRKQDIQELPLDEMAQDTKEEQQGHMQGSESSGETPQRCELSDTNLRKFSVSSDSIDPDGEFHDEN